MVVFDATTLLLLVAPNAAVPNDPATGLPVEAPKERMDFLVRELERAKTKIIIPTPALSEILVHSGAAGAAYLEMLNRSASFRIAPFEERAAVEVAAMTKLAYDGGDKRGGIEAPWTKIKYDRQIVAIAKVEQASTIYSDDERLRTAAQRADIGVVRISELPLPPEERQQTLKFDEQAAQSHDTKNDTDQPSAE